MATATTSRASSWIWLSVAAAVATIGLKSAAAAVSGSVGFLSDAMESGVNLVAALVTMVALRWSEAPPDAEHPFGHAKGELLAALLEGVLVLCAGVAIVGASLERLLHPAPLVSAPLAVALSVAATLINAVVGWLLVRVGRQARSPALEADGHHLLTDVWTSVAVIAGVTLVFFTGAAWLDPLSGVVVAGFVVVTGVRILQSAMGGLVDSRLAAPEEAAVNRALEPFRTDGVDFTTLQTRQAGRHVFVHLTVLVPGSWSVERAHTLADEVERAVAKELGRATVDTHIEPLPAAK